MSRDDDEEQKKKKERRDGSLVPRLCPAFLRLQYELQVTESWAAPRSEARSNAVMNRAIGAPTLEQRIDGICPEMKFD